MLASFPRSSRKLPLSAASAERTSDILYLYIILTYLDLHVLTQQFFLAEGVLCLPADDVHWPLLQLALDGTEQDEQGLPHMLLQTGAR